MKILIYILVFILNIIYIGSVFAIETKVKRVNFSQSIAYQKKSVKIYGKTIKNSKIIITIGKKEYRVKSNTKGNYSLKLHNLKVGKYKVISKVYFQKDKYYLVPREKEIILSLSYINKLQSYYVKKLKKVISKPIIEKLVLHSVALKKLEKPKTVVNFFLLNILLGVVIFLMGFLVLKKHKLI